MKRNVKINSRETVYLQFLSISEIECLERVTRGKGVPDLEIAYEGYEIVTKVTTSDMAVNCDVNYFTQHVGNFINLNTEKTLYKQNIYNDLTTLLLKTNICTIDNIENLSIDVLKKRLLALTNKNTIYKAKVMHEDSESINFYTLEPMDEKELLVSDMMNVFEKFE